ncbi:MAG TPA: TrkA C-terminal domain-containing protein [Symbiobacteriaceae bacterium]|nr:TrkA C-terminal domain-containing protein [Symbiobacteriaceae bacterium]
MKRETGGRARYEEIAFDLAKRIVQGELPEGTRVLGRSSLAGTYQVSPETIRRAVAILHERSIVQSVAGSGIRVLSRMAASEYLNSQRAMAKLEEGARELFDMMKARREMDERIEALLERVLSQATGVLASPHVEEFPVAPEAWVVGRALNEIRLRSRTGATAVVVTRGETETFSPPADWRLEEGDVITVLGSDEARARARDLLSRAAPPVNGD